jgi:signal transduction histidine kinase
MVSFLEWVRAALVSLLLFELVLLALRFPLTPSRLELLWFTGILMLVAAAGLLPAAGMTIGTASLLVLWAFGNYAGFLKTENRSWAWHGAAGFVMAVFLLVRAMGWSGTLPFYLLFSFLLSLLSLYPLSLLAGICRENVHPLLYLYTAAAALQAATLVYDFLSSGTPLPVLNLRLFSALVYCTVCGLLLSQVYYLQGSGWQGLHIRLDAQQERLRQAHSRLIQTENTLMLQDRLIDTGILAAGAAHEFKNTMALIQSTAGFALRSRDESSVRQALELIGEQAQSGQKAVLELLDHLLKQGREKAGRIRLKTDLELLYKMIRTGCRREGIHLSLEIPDSVGVRARRGELEQVIVNLIRNAIDSVKGAPGSAPGGAAAGPGGSERRIRIRCRNEEGQAVMEVIDSGGGVPPELQNRIFEPSVSGKRSTGLGLFLAKTLVERNGGSLIYVPMDRGGCFRIVLPYAAPDRASG